jgi:hypothetical protein
MLTVVRSIVIEAASVDSVRARKKRQLYTIRKRI